MQFNHRLLALLTVSAIVVLWWRARFWPLSGVARRALHLVVGVALLQLSLGIATLLLRVPVALGVAHQGGAVLLVTAALLLVHAVRGARPVPPVAAPGGDEAIAP